MRWRNCDDRFSRVDTIPEHDGQTDGRTDRIPISISPVSIAVLTGYKKLGSAKHLGLYNPRPVPPKPTVRLSHRSLRLILLLRMLSVWIKFDCDRYIRNTVRACERAFTQMQWMPGKVARDEFQRWRENYMPHGIKFSLTWWNCNRLVEGFRILCWQLAGTSTPTFYNPLYFCNREASKLKSPHSLASAYQKHGRTKILGPLYLVLSRGFSALARLHACNKFGVFNYVIAELSRIFVARCPA